MTKRDNRASRPVGLRSAWAAALLFAGAWAAPVAAQVPPQAADRIDAIATRLRAANPDRCAAADAHCGGRVVLSNVKGLNAWTDGRSVSVTTRMVRFAADEDALAFVIAHEMAHNLLGHAEQLKGVSHRFADDETAARIRATEVAADRLAIDLVRAAGFDPGAAERLFRRLAKRQMPMPTSYPSLAQRITVVRIATGPSGGDAMGGRAHTAVR